MNEISQLELITHCTFVSQRNENSNKKKTIPNKLTMKVIKNMIN